MTELQIEIKYPYGPALDKPGYVLIHTDRMERDALTRVSFIEGHFLSATPPSTNNPICLREQMKDFEREHSGIFQRLSDLVRQ